MKSNVLAITAVLALGGCGTSGTSGSIGPVVESPTPEPRTLVLVHGAFADHHAFDGVRPRLEAHGYRVIAPDLPAHGAQPATGPVTLDAYVAAVTGVIDAVPGEVILVGHSMAGIVIAQVAENRPHKISQLVFVAAYLPTSGQSLQALAETDTASVVGQNMVFAADHATVTIEPDKIVEAICADVPEEIQRMVVASQKPEPVAPFQGVVTLTAANFGAVKKAYLRTTQDRAVTPTLQGRMLAAYPAIPSAAIDTSHLPFVARPDEFVEALDRLIAAAR